MRDQNNLWDKWTGLTGPDPLFKRGRGEAGGRGRRL